MTAVCVGKLDGNGVFAYVLIDIAVDGKHIAVFGFELFEPLFYRFAIIEYEFAERNIYIFRRISDFD